MNAKTLEAVRRHGETLLAAFPNATERDPITLCKKLRRIETAISRPILDYCNGEGGMTDEVLTAQWEHVLRRVASLLGMTDAAIKATGLFINRDPRGYALKFDSTWTHNRNGVAIRDKEPTIYTDLGGYGILAPDLNPEKD